MKKLFLLPLLVSIFLISCNSDESKEVESEEIVKPEQVTNTEEIVAIETVSDIDTKSTSTNPVEENTPTVSVEDEVVIPFYNDLLLQLYPNRNLKTEWHEDELDYDRSLAENIEGGGVSRRYIRVIEDGYNNVGLIGFQVFDNMVYTSSFAILNSNNTLCAARIIDVNDYAILQVTSNTSGLLDEGPYNYSYYYFDREDDRITPLYEVKDKENYTLNETECDLIIETLLNQK